MNYYNFLSQLFISKNISRTRLDEKSKSIIFILESKRKISSKQEFYKFLNIKRWAKKRPFNVEKVYPNGSEASDPKLISHTAVLKDINWENFIEEARVWHNQTLDQRVMFGKEKQNSVLIELLATKRKKYKNNELVINESELGDDLLCMDFIAIIKDLEKKKLLKVLDLNITLTPRKLYYRISDHNHFEVHLKLTSRFEGVIKGFSDKSITFQRKTNNKGRLTIEDYRPLEFEGIRCSLIDFFYNADDRKEWKTYDDIKNGMPNQTSTSTIRKAIEFINRRVKRGTNNNYKEIIENKSGIESNSPRSYRWKI